MGGWHREHPEEATRIAALPLSEQNAAERASMRYAVEKARIQARHEGDPAYETHESPARLRLREEWEREEERP